jgi:CheY-like chemotaxis protein/HPt (histidine-containing phosphotransfer) domain-containing protein
MMRFKAHEKGLELLLNVPVDIPRFVFTDPVRLRQILVNLLGNALKFTDEGEVELKIEMHREEADTNSARFTFGIRDTGIGIPKDKQHKIFESFSQADNTTTRKYGGTGLGLAISARLVEMMGSSLLIESEEGLGSRFFFTVDLKTEEGEPLDRQNFSHISKVLIVDDNETNRLILQRMLDGVGIKSDMAENGVEALSLVGGNNGYDVVIMDYNMPGMNGIETIRSIRNRIGLPKPEQPVIFLHSSSDDQEIRNESQKLGVSHAVIKPVKMSQLLAALTAVESKSAPAGVEPALNNDLQTVLHEAVNTYRIMIAEDNRTNMILARAIINRLLPGSEVIQAVNGAEAVENYRLYRPDFIFMDIQMPEMNGYDAVKQIREIESSGNRHCPVVALTAGTVKGEEARCIEAGMDDYISKPVVESTIERVIRTWLTHRSEIPQQSLNGLPEGGLLHFDYNILLNRLNGDKELVKVLLLDATNRYPEMAGNLRAAFQKENCMEVRLIAHSLKGAARSICCYGLADIATRIELLTGEDKSRLLGLLELLDEELKILLGDFRMIIHDEVPEEK